MKPTLQPSHMPWRRLLLMSVAVLSTLASGPRMIPLPGGAVSRVLPEGGSVAAETQRGGFANFQLSPHCVQALVAVAIACSQVGPAGLAGCGVVLHRTQGSCP